MDNSSPAVDLVEKAHSNLELFQVFDTSDLDIWELLSATKKYSSDPVILPLICQKLSALDSSEVDFFLPQLCQLVLDKGNGVLPVRRLLIDNCRKSIRTGILASFFFRSAHADKIASQEQLCQRMEVDLEHAVLSGNKNKDLGWQIELYQRHCEHVSQKKTHEIIESQKENVATIETVSISDSVDLIYAVTEMTERKNADRVKELSRDHERDSIPYDGSDSSAEWNAEEKEPLPPDPQTLAPPQSAHLGPGTQTPNENHNNNTHVAKTRPQCPLPQPPQTYLNGPQDQANTPLTEPTTLDDRRLSPIDIHPRCKMCGQVVEPSESATHTKSCDVSLQKTLRPPPHTAILNGELTGNKYDKLEMLACLATHIIRKQNQLAPNEATGHYRLLLDELYNSTKTLQPLNPQLKESFIKLQIPCPLTKPLEETHLPLTLPSKNGLAFQITSRKVRREYFKSQLLFIKTLTDISSFLKNLNLKDKPTKNLTLQHALAQLNHSMTSMRGIYIPILSPDGTPYRVVRIPPEESLCLNSRDRVPFLINVEVVSGIVESKILLEGKPPEKPTPLPPVPPPVPESDDDWLIVGSERPYLDRIFGPDWETRKKRIQEASPMGSLPGWAGDDLRQEQLAMQLIQLFADIFESEGVKCLQLTPYMVLATSGDAGLIETIHDAVSIHGLKASEGFESLLKHFERAYPSPMAFKAAQTNFIESVAAYSLVTYILQIKDRHNGNIMIDREGRIIHIDYGFMLSSSPGNIAFETSPFKLSQEMLAVMGGTDRFCYFKSLFLLGFLALRKNYCSIVTTIEMMIKAGGGMACFKGGDLTIQHLKDRFQLLLNESEIIKYCNGLVVESCDNWRTGIYDNFQYWSNGIL